MKSEASLRRSSANFGFLAKQLLLTELHKTKHAAVDRPREGHRPANRSRYIPVWLSSARRSTRRRWLTSNGSHPNQGGGGFVGLMEVERRYVTVTQRAGKRGEGSRSLSSFLFTRDALVYCMLKN